MRLRWLAILLFVLCAPAAHGQFKWIDQDGRVGYGDKPPPGARHIESLSGVSRGTQPDQTTQLPYQLQRTIKDFPVTLYTTSGCDACDSGRTMLKARAVPFSERTIRSADDAEALKKLVGTEQLPVVQIGSRVITGYNSPAWDDALDLAGYPRGGSLPADWVWPAATPLTAPAAPQPAASEGAPAPSPENSKQQ